MYKLSEKNQYTLGIQSGFTLVELFLVIVIAGIVVSMASSNFGPWIKDIRLARASDAFYSSAIQARAAAQRKQTQVSLCRTGNIYSTDPSCSDNIYSSGDSLDSRDWTYGWLIYETSGPLVGYSSALGHQLVAVVDTKVDDNNVRIISNNDAQTFLTYGPDGKLDTGSPILAVCDDRDGGQNGYRITFSASGRVSVKNFGDLSGPDQDCTP